MNNPVILRTQNLSIGYHEKVADPTTISSEINLEFVRGTLTCLIGPNGAGKSTLIRTLIGLQKQLHGNIWLNEIPLKNIANKDLSKYISIVLTEKPDTINMTAYELVSLGRHPYTNWLGELSNHDHDMIQQSMLMTNSYQLHDRQLHTLSDGERQKVMIARALAQEPVFMVLDEPTAFLDFPHRIDILHMLRDLVRHRPCAVLLSTHDLELALNTADNILLMDENGALSSGAPEDLVLNGGFDKAFNPRGKLSFDPYTASFNFTAKAGAKISISCEDDLVKRWTIHALERIGCSVEESNRLPQIHVVHENTEYIWEYCGKNHETLKFTSIYPLMTHIQSTS